MEIERLIIGADKFKVKVIYENGIPINEAKYYYEDGQATKYS